MKIGSLFSGIGGLELGIEAVTGAETVWQCDNFKPSLAVLERHWPNAKRYLDIKDVDHNAERADIICGGFPCQPHSTAGTGKRKGTDDSRWLWPEFYRVITVLRPDVVFIENVRGLRTSGMRNVLEDLANAGYDAKWDCFTAAETGAPHERARIFILAYSNGDGLEKITNKVRIRNEADRWAVSRRFGKGCNESLWPEPRPIGVRPLGVDDGIPYRMDLDRIKMCGNAVVPFQAALAFSDLICRVI